MVQVVAVEQAVNFSKSNNCRLNRGNKIRPPNNLLDLIALIYLKVTRQYSSARGLVELVSPSTSRKARQVPREKSGNTDGQPIISSHVENE